MSDFKNSFYKFCKFSVMGYDSSYWKSLTSKCPFILNQGSFSKYLKLFFELLEGREKQILQDS